MILLQEGLQIYLYDSITGGVIGERSSLKRRGHRG